MKKRSARWSWVALCLLGVGCTTVAGLDRPYHPVDEQGGSNGGGGGGSGGSGGGGGGDGDGGGGGVETGSRCAGLPATCGPAGDESCCTSELVTGGAFNRNNDPAFPATVSDFLLDRFEVTLGRFRAFVDAYPGSRPAVGAGAHPRIAGSGWYAAWDEQLPLDRSELLSGLLCDSEGTAWVWTDEPGANERLAMNCVSWYLAFAFCAWDGGRLPTDAELGYAAAGGAEQRPYPWSTSPDDLAIDPEHAVYACIGSDVPGCVLEDILPVGAMSPQGDGLFKQADLAGGVYEWALDWHADYSPDCVDCAVTAGGTERVIRGGGWRSAEETLLLSTRDKRPPTTRTVGIGFRCARDP
ncbi:formylglycine-generating enzyme family protein [Sorangium sp. So ce1097]|uniref:formylglycine-generating enzyme family protein n=1 Tax=Sorangium sp. So ce1097 TaxID=3133330 RepID=UPI003F61B85D